MSCLLRICRRCVVLTMIAGIMGVWIIDCFGGDLPYVKKATWRETLDESIRATRNGAAKDYKPLFTTAVVKAESGAVPISVDVTGQKHLVLVATDGGDGRTHDHAAYVNAKLVDANGKTVWLSELRPKRVVVGYDRYRKASDDEKTPVVFGKKRYSRYMRAHAPSGIHFKIDGKYTRFEAVVGIDQGAGKQPGSVVFSVTDNPVNCPVPVTQYGTQGVAPFWLKLRENFPDRAPLTMAVRDWLRCDKLQLAMKDAAFEEPTKRRLELADKSLEYVKEAGANVEGLKRELVALQEKMKGVDAGFTSLYLDACLLRRRIIFSHPALDFDQLLINVNPPTSYNHNGDQFLARHSREGKGLLVLSGWKEESTQSRFILKGKLPEGAYRSPDLSFDADKLLFAFADYTETNKHHRRYFLYEAAVDGSWIRQITGSKRDPLKTWDDRATVLIEDNDPCYLPDGRVAFLSTRSQTFGRCHGGRYNPAWVLHVCDADGGNISQLSFGNENEIDPAVLNDGRIAFTRWEYTDRHEMYFHKLWTCRPDGTSIAHLFGNDMTVPHQFLEVSAIPNSTKIVAVGQGHHSYNSGTIVVIDPNVADNGEKAITRVTPETAYSESQGWPNVHYSHPYPITEDLFLASRANHRMRGRFGIPAADRAIYLVDTLGGRELIYEDPDMASFSPIPIRTRKRPPAIPRMAHGEPEKGDFGTVFVQNAYLTRNDPKGVIKPGMIKAVRVIALGVQPRARREGVNLYAGNNIPKKILGTVPVDKDGTAFFKVPARTSIQVQTLDENGMALLTERSFFYLQPGENRGCIGCHEPYGATPNMESLKKMRTMKPVELQPPAGPQYKGGFSYVRTVQPVLDQYCISCHGLGEGKDPKAKKLDLTNKPTRGNYTVSYTTLARYGDPKVGSKGSMGRAERNISRPRDFYAYRNKVSHMLVKNHGNCNMDKDSYMRIIEWLDTNSLFYGDMFPNKLESRKLTNEKSKETLALRKLIRDRFGKKLADQPLHTLINKVQVPESRILMAPLAKATGGWEQVAPLWKSKNDPSYKEMLAAVNACIITKKNENVNGWEPTLVQGAGEIWVMDARKKFRATVTSKKKMPKKTVTR